MRALRFDLSLAKYAAALAVKPFYPLAALGPLSCLSLTDIPEPQPPSQDWLKLQVTHAGVCGSDISLLMYKTSPALSPFSSFPCVPGHEVIGRVAQASSSALQAAGVKEGDRVAIEPVLGCEARGLSTWCIHCKAGDTGVCEHTTYGPLASGMLLGFQRDLPGGWGEQMAV